MALRSFSMPTIVIIGRESPAARHAEALRRAGVKVALVPGSDVIVYTYDERRGGSIEVVGEEALEYLESYRLKALSSSS